MKKIIVDVTAQAKAVREICGEYVSDIANQRYKELMATIKENETISMMVSMIGEALLEEQKRLEKEIESELLSRGGDTHNVYFDNYRYCLSNSKEMKIALTRLMGW